MTTTATALKETAATDAVIARSTNCVGHAIFVAAGPATIGLRDTTAIDVDGRLFTLTAETPIAFVPPAPGSDCVIGIAADGSLRAWPVTTREETEPGYILGGFHYAPGGNAAGRNGGDAGPAINPCSIWDRGFRPACPDPRGMAYVAESPGMPGVTPFWADIYLLAQDHLSGTSRHGAVIADGDAHLPVLEGDITHDALDYKTATAIFAEHGKGLLSLPEFFAAAYGVTERTTADDETEHAGLDAPRTSRFGLMQATGQRSAWGHDGDPDEPRASWFGGYWGNGGWAGSRVAFVDYWPGFSLGWISARGRSDHLQLA